MYSFIWNKENVNSNAIPSQITSLINANQNPLKPKNILKNRSFDNCKVRNGLLWGFYIIIDEW